MEQSPQNIQEEGKVFWPQKEQFFKDRDSYVHGRLEEVKTLLKQNDFKDIYLDEVASILLRGYYLADYMIHNSPIEISIPIDISSNMALPNNVGGCNIPVFSLNNEKDITKERLKEVVVSEEIENLTIDKIDVLLNLGGLKNNIEYLDQFRSRFLKKHGESTRQEIDDDTKKKMEELAIQFETSAIEEIAHAFYWIAISKDPKKFKQGVIELINYDHAEADTDPSKYHDTVIEKRAALWNRSYLKHFYPESDAYKEEKQIRTDQKERAENKIRNQSKMNLDNN